MLESILLTIALLFTSHAASAAELDPSLIQATEQSTQAPAGEPTAQGLGPASNPSGAGGSNADGGALQPAGTSTLQPGGSSTGLTAPNSQTLQAPASASDTLKVLAGEADGAPQTPGSTEPSLLQWLLTSVVIALLLGAIGIVWWRDRRQTPDADDQAEALPEVQEPESKLDEDVPEAESEQPAAHNDLKDDSADHSDDANDSKSDEHEGGNPQHHPASTKPKPD